MTADQPDQKMDAKTADQPDTKLETITTDQPDTKVEKSSKKVQYLVVDTSAFIKNTQLQVCRG
jgi:hypothetical protein